MANDDSLFASYFWWRDFYNVTHWNLNKSKGIPHLLAKSWYNQSEVEPQGQKWSKCHLTADTLYFRAVLDKLWLRSNNVASRVEPDLRRLPHLLLNGDWTIFLPWGPTLI